MLLQSQSNHQDDILVFCDINLRLLTEITLRSYPYIWYDNTNWDKTILFRYLQLDNKVVYEYNLVLGRDLQLNFKDNLIGVRFTIGN